MNWVSSMGRRFIQAYTEGLVMTCPMHRCEETLAQAQAQNGAMPAAIDRPQDNARAALRTTVAANARQMSPTSSVRH